MSRHIVGIITELRVTVDGVELPSSFARVYYTYVSHSIMFVIIFYNLVCIQYKLIYVRESMAVVASCFHG